MKRILALTLAAAMMLAFSACGDKPTDGKPGEKEDSKPMEYNVMYSAELDDLNYLKTAMSTNYEMNVLMLDSLVDYDKYGVMIPALAESWTLSPDETVYTFKLRQGVKWYDHTGAEYGEVKAQDWVDAAKWMLDDANASTCVSVFYAIVKNANAFYKKEITDFSQVGVRAVDEYTLEYTLMQPAPYFLSMVTAAAFYPANGAFIAEKGEMFGTSNENVLYCGPYIMNTYEPESQRVLTANENYWDKENIHISKITYQFNKEAKTLAPEAFLRGETHTADIPLDLIGDWKKDEAKSQYIQKKPYSDGVFFLGFAFGEPLYKDQKELNPQDWLTAANNRDFRKSIYHGLDRIGAISTIEPYTPEEKVSNTIIPKDLLFVNGVDYTQMGNLKAISDATPFDPTQALEYKAKAMEALKGKVSLPIKIMIPYNTGNVGLVNRVQVIEQQLEKLLGAEYIDIVPTVFPATGYLRAAQYSIMEMSFVPDYADPATWSSVFTNDSFVSKKFNKPFLATEYLDADGKGKHEKMLYEARKETKDMYKRYEMFANADAFAIEEAFVVPFYVTGGDYFATYLDQFSGNSTCLGRDVTKLKGKILLDKPMTVAEYEAAAQKYETERMAALKAAGTK